MANASRHALYLIQESTYGTTPTTPSFTAIRHTGTTLGMAKGSQLSEELRADRQVAEFRHGIREVGGDISCELSFESLDLLLQAVFQGTWVDDAGVKTLKAGTTRRSFSVMRHFGDILTAGEPFHLFTGVEFNTMSMSVTPDGIVGVTFGVIGRNASSSESGVSGQTLGTPNTNRVFNAFGGSVLVDGSPFAIATELSFTLENGMEARPVIGSDMTISPSNGRSNLTGSLGVWFEDSSFVKKFWDEENISIAFTLVDPDGNEFEVTIPNISLTGGQPDVSGQAAIPLTVPFQAVYDSGISSQIQIVTTPAP